MASPPDGYDVLPTVYYPTCNVLNATTHEHITPNVAYRSSNAAGPTHSAAAHSFRGFRDTLTLNSPALLSNASLPRIPEDPSAYGRNIPGYER
jgi:hypothetical protein